MLVVYIDSDVQMQEKVSEMFRHSHRIITFSELFEAYKWIKRNQIPDLIVTEIDIENSMGLQALKFLQSKSKLKNTYKIGYTQHYNDEYRNLTISEGASEIFSKVSLLQDLSNYLNFVSGKTSTTRVGNAVGTESSKTGSSKKHLSTGQKESKHKK